MEANDLSVIPTRGGERGRAGAKGSGARETSATEATVTVVEARAAVPVAVEEKAEAARSYDTCEGGGGEG